MQKHVQTFRMIIVNISLWFHGLFSLATVCILNHFLTSAVFSTFSSPVQNPGHPQKSPKPPPPQQVAPRPQLSLQPPPPPIDVDYDEVPEEEEETQQSSQVND